jgi:glutathione S-transferase
MQHLILHEDPISGNCYKIKLTASILSIPLETRSYRVLNGETRTPNFLTEVSSFGRIPVLQLGESTFLPESNAACFYLADTTPSAILIPSDPLQRAEMMRWMFFEQNQHEVSIATLRFWLKYIGKDKLTENQKAQVEGKAKAGAAVLDYMDDHLSKSERGWFVGSTLTLADIVLFAYTHVAHEGGFDLSGWPHVKRWCEKVTTVDGFIPMNAEG